MNVKGLTQEQKRDLFDRDRRIEAVLSMMVENLVKSGHTWTDEESKAYGWVARTLGNDIKELAA